MANTSAYTYDDGALREDLLDVITNLSPKNTQLVSGLGTSTADSIYHQWLIDTLGTVKTNAYPEGADVSYQNLTNPTRLSNVTQIFQEAFQVPGTERAANTAGFEDRYAYEAKKAMTELANDLEYALVRGSIACGDGSTARQLRGIKNSLSLVTSQSGISLTETILNDYLQNVWDVSREEVDAIYCPMYLKRKISGFTTNTKNIQAADKRLVNAVDVYNCDAATEVKLFAHRYVTVSGDTNYDIIGINEDYFKVAYLRKPKVEEIAKTGDADKGVVIAEATLENRHYNAGFVASQHL